MLSVQRETERRSEAADSSRYRCTQHGRASPIVLRVLAVSISFVRGALLARRRTGAYEWNKCARMYDLAAFTTHKREEVSVEELRAHAMVQAHSSPSS